MGDFSNTTNSNSGDIPMPITNSMTDLCNNIVEPEGTSLAPEGTSLAPEGTSLAPEGTSLAPEGTSLAPEGTSLAPEGRGYVPDFSADHPAEDISKDGDSSISEESETDNFFVIDQDKYHKVKTLFSGSEADMLLVNNGSKDFALKLYKKGHSPNKKIYQSLEKLNGGDYIVDLLSYGKIDGREYELMPYFPLGSTASITDIKGNSTAVMNIVLKCALSLNKCHETGFVHMDVKPANILVTDKENWDCVLCDFGISETLDHGQALLAKQNRTPTYAAPEIYGNRFSNTIYKIDGKEYIPIEPSADFYSLGMTAISLWMGEAKLRKNEEKEMVLSKIACAIDVPKDMPDKLKKIVNGLLMNNPKNRWGYKQIVDFVSGGKNISTSDADFFEFQFKDAKVAHTKEDLAMFMLNEITLASVYLYKGILSSFFANENHNDWAAQLNEITEDKFKREQTLGVLAAVHYLNPFYDICYNSNCKSTNYAMTLESIAEVLNDVYIWKYVEGGNPEVLKTKELVYPEIYNRIANSFEQYEGSYLQAFFLSKGNRFLEADKVCAGYIADSHNPKRIAPKDSETATQIAFMQVISAFFPKEENKERKPKFRFKESQDFFESMEEFDFLHGTREKADALNYGLKGWLAVQFFADPRKTMEKKYEFERQVQAYTEKIGAIDSRNNEYTRYLYASKEAKSILTSKRIKVATYKTRGVLQTLFSIIAILIPLIYLCIYYVGSAVECASLPDAKFTDLGYFCIPYGIAAATIYFFYGKDRGCLNLIPVIFGVAVGFAFKYLLNGIGPKFLWVIMVFPIIGLVASIYAIFFSSKLKVTPKKPEFEELVIEPLGYAYSLKTNERFDSSLNAISDSSLYDKKSLIKRRKAIIACFAFATACFLGLVSLPVPTKVDSKTVEIYESIFSSKSNNINDAVQEMSDKQ